MNDPEGITPATCPDAFCRIPGLYRRWELQQVLETGSDFHIEEGGVLSDGTQLFAVYRRRTNSQEEA
jgi:hypothetical protein